MLRLQSHWSCSAHTSAAADSSANAGAHSGTDPSAADPSAYDPGAYSSANTGPDTGTDSIPGRDMCAAN